MVQGNNMIPRGTGRKHWRNRVKTHFDIPMKKLKRKLTRRRKASNLFPRPLEKLSPIIRCCQAKFNMKLRQGKGFSFEELKQANLKPQYARTIGIFVDPRRRNKNVEEMKRNVDILKNYTSKLVVIPRDPKKEIQGLKLNEFLKKVPRTSAPVKVEEDKKIEFQALTDRDTKRSAIKILLNERKRANKKSYDIAKSRKLAKKSEGKEGEKKEETKDE